MYRASSPAGPYSKINTELVTGTQFIDTSGAVVGAGSGSGGGTYYYGVTSEDGDGDESAQSLGVSPASIVSSGGGGGGCFIDTVSHSIPQPALWFLVLLSIGIAICSRCRVSGVRQIDFGLRNAECGLKEKGIRRQASGIRH